MYKTWTTKKGAEIRIIDMTDLHLVNAIKMLQRNWDRRYKKACGNVDSHTTIASASDCNPAPSYDWFKPLPFDSLVSVAKARGLNI